MLQILLHDKAMDPAYDVLKHGFELNPNSLVTITYNKVLVR